MPTFVFPFSIAVQPSAVAALTIGGLALLLWALVAQAPGLLRRMLSGSARPRLQRLAQAAAWPYLGRLLGVGYAVGFLALALEWGRLAPHDAGLVALNWEDLAGWLPAVAGLTSLWAAILWGAYWAGARRPDDRISRAACGGLPEIPVHLVGEEAWAGILRGALTPALGLYWGAWASACVRTLAALLSPAARRRLLDHRTRPFAYLDWAMEWVAAGCFAVSGSLWASLIARSAGYVAVILVHACLGAWSRHRPHDASAPETGAALAPNEQPPAPRGEAGGQGRSSSEG